MRSEPTLSIWSWSTGLLSRWFADNGAGSGVYRVALRLKIMVTLGDTQTVFQMEVRAVEICIKTIKDEKYGGHSVVKRNDIEDN